MESDNEDDNQEDPPEDSLNISQVKFLEFCISIHLHFFFTHFFIIIIFYFVSVVPLSICPYLNFSISPSLQQS